jgi:hypothetical protein
LEASLPYFPWNLPPNQGFIHTGAGGFILPSDRVSRALDSRWRAQPWLAEYEGVWETLDGLARHSLNGQATAAKGMEAIRGNARATRLAAMLDRKYYHVGLVVQTAETKAEAVGLWRDLLAQAQAEGPQSAPHSQPAAFGETAEAMQTIAACMVSRIDVGNALLDRLQWWHDKGFPHELTSVLMSDGAADRAICLATFPAE